MAVTRDQANDDTHPSFIQNGGEMGARIRGYDWAATSLGVPAAWPQGLRTAVRLVLNIPQPAFIFWGDDRICLYNDAFAEIFAADESGVEAIPDALGKPARAVWEAAWPTLGPFLDRLVAAGPAPDVGAPEVPEALAANGWQAFSFSPIDDDSSPTGIGGGLALASRPAAERAGELEALRKSEAHYRSIYDHVPVLIWEEDWAEVKAMLLALREAGVTDFADYFARHPGFVTAAIHEVRVHNVNRTGARLFGARSSRELLSQHTDVIEKPASMALFAQAMAAFMAGKREFESESDTTDLNGQRLRLYVKMLIPDVNASDTRLVLTQMDITALRSADERFSVVVKATSDVVWDYDMIAGTVWCSDGIRERFGLDPGDFRSGRATWSDHLHPDERERVLSDQARLIAEGATSWQAAYRFRRGDGSYAHIEDRGTFVRDGSGTVIRMIGSMVDVTHQKQIEDQLRQSQRLDAIGQLTGGVAHDFNNLLTVILGNSEVLSEMLADRPVERRMADMSASAAERGAELTNRLLAFARRQPLQPAETDLNQLISGMDGLLRRTLRENINIDLVAARDLWTTELDPGQLEVAILNLAINARDAMPDGGRLTIETANCHFDERYSARHDEVEAGAYVMVAVSDTGEGMAPEVVARAFEPFFTTKEVGKGSGLGLSLVYGFAKQSGGHATIYSELGEGTTVRLYFPRSVATRDEAVPNAGGVSVPVGTERILVVEDDNLVCEHLVSQLEGLGYAVTSAGTGAAALDLLKQGDPFDLLFTDVIMPGGLNGKELADAARVMLPEIRVLFTSGYTENTIFHHGRLDRGVHLLGKPYRRQDLALKVRAVLDE
ncbi:PAS domain-containing protein [Fodinicurvata sp. EGI_FJ10296]|uniref:hybrid sensor histidine kinase/response regulator n=1 Tax=Fodinicurvata sp. EGI_FJ10296 TaxID=3231908 RepID=UPI0034541F8F